MLKVVNFLLRGWIKNLESGGSVVLPLLEEAENVCGEVTKDLEFSRSGCKKSVRVQFHGSNYSVWSWLTSLFQKMVTHPST